jgi:hypothetical protein
MTERQELSEELKKLKIELSGIGIDLTNIYRAYSEKIKVHNNGLEPKYHLNIISYSSVQAMLNGVTSFKIFNMKIMKIVMTELHKKQEELLANIFE